MAGGYVEGYHSLQSQNSSRKRQDGEEQIPRTEKSPLSEKSHGEPIKPVPSEAVVHEK